MSFNYGNKVLFKPHTNKRAICEPTVWLLQLDIKGLYTSKMAPWHVKNSTPRGVGGAILYMIPECNRAFGQCGYKSHLDTKLTEQTLQLEFDSSSFMCQAQTLQLEFDSSSFMCRAQTLQLEFDSSSFMCRAHSTARAWQQQLHVPSRLYS